MIGQVLLKFVKLELQVECLLADMAFFPSFPPDFFFCLARRVSSPDYWGQGLAQ